MPANLNALIRYKTINSCLSGGRRKWSIHELMSACSEALAEARGRYEPVSERTVRDDIRVMRSDILGFNAPIAQEKGLYYYSDPAYSIMTMRITDAGLAGQIIKMLLDIRTKTNHPELEIILEKLIGMTGIVCPEIQEKYSSGEKPAAKMPRDRKKIRSSKSRFDVPDNLYMDEAAPAMEQEAAIFFPVKKDLTWGAIFRFVP